MKKPLITSKNLDQKAYQVIKEMIENRVLEPGQKIPQEKLAAELGISRTPLISALKFLEHEKLVRSEPRRGFFVRLFSLEEMVSIFEIREVLEGLSARRAAKSISTNQVSLLRGIFEPFIDSDRIDDYQAYSRADRRFHNFIAAISAGEFLHSILETYNFVSLAHLYPTREGLIRPPAETITEHLAVVEAIMSHDPIEAEQRMRFHLQRTTAKLVHDIETRQQSQTREVNRRDRDTDERTTLSS